MAFAAPAAGAQELELDLYAFTQDDAGGHPLRAEGMSYGGLRVALDAELSDGLDLHMSAAGSVIDNEAAAALPPTVTQVLTTQASAEIITLDTQVTLAIRVGDGPLTLIPGAYYHHQRRFVSLGADLTGRLELAGGDTQVALTYSVRMGLLKPRRWDDLIMPFDYLWSHNVIAAWSQTLSPAAWMSVSAQFTRQDGPLQDAFNYVVLYDAFVGDAVALDFENLPRVRNRGQISLRARVTPVRGMALGIDTSLYLDDWGVRHAAIEPSAEFPLGRRSSLRLWYRFGTQSQARYYRPRPEQGQRYQTQDADLAAFSTHTPGLLLRFPLGSEGSPSWAGRLAAFGLFRSDGISAFGANVGVTAAWP